MKKVLTFKNPEMVTSKDGRLKLVELKVRIEEICAIHRTEDGKQHVLAIFIHEEKPDYKLPPKCYAFHISEKDYEIAKPIFSEYIKKQKGGDGNA